MYIFKQNGFEFAESPQEDGRLTLSAVPFSKGVTLGVDDVMELVGMLVDEGGGGGGGRSSSLMMMRNVRIRVAGSRGGRDTTAATGRESPADSIIPRPSKIRTMLASRACRSSIMIGTALTRKTMERVLAHMTALECPWNCAHGRPTMRHLAVL